MEACVLAKNEGNSYEDLLECLWCKATNIRENNKRVHLGYYKNKEDAIEIRKLKEIELYGEFAQKQAT